MRPITVLFSVLLIASVFFATKFQDDAKAYQLTGFKFDHLTLTYSCGNDELAQAVQMWASVSALKDGGCTDTKPDITLTIVPSKDWTYGGAAGVAGPGHLWIKAPYEHHLGIMLHETGHAIGMGHSSETFAEPNYLLRTAAMFAWCCNPLNDDDIAGIQALYGVDPGDVPPPKPNPYPYKLRAVGVAADR